MRPIAYRLTGLLLALSCCSAFAQTAPTQVPLGGNAYITIVSPSGDELIDDNGLHNWDSTQAVISTYFDVQQAGQLDLSLIGSLSGASHSTVKVSIGHQSHLVNLSSTGTAPFSAGTFTVDKPGYVKVDLQGVSTDGGYYGDISNLQIGGSATAAGTVFANDPTNFYWSLRGPRCIWVSPCRPTPSTSTAKLRCPRDKIRSVRTTWPTASMSVTSASR